MGSPKELAVELSCTPRGRLSYDRECFKGQSSLEEILEEVEAQNRVMKTSLIAELSSEIHSLTHEELFPSSPRGETQAKTVMTVKGIQGKSPSSPLSSLSPSPRRHILRLNRSLELSCPSEFSVVREAKRRSLERRIVLDSFIRDEVREAELLFAKKCKIMSEENPVSINDEEEKENRILDKIRAEDKIKEQECKHRISVLEEKIAAVAQPPPVREPPKLEPQLVEQIPLPPTPIAKEEPSAPPSNVEFAGPPSLTPMIKSVVEKQPSPVKEEATPTPTLPPVIKPEKSTESSQRNLQILHDIQGFHSSFKTKLSGFSDKSLKFDLQKAVSTIINAICQVSKAHLKEKLEKLTALSSGQPALVGETKTVNSSSHPLGTDYVKYIMAEKFISHWDEQPKSIFALSAIMAALSSQFPDFGKLLLAVFYRTCPYVLPSHCVQRGEESFKDYRIRCGYSYDEDQEEDKEMFIKHMTGVIRLYTSYSIAELPQSHADRLVSHGLGNLWKLISSTLNLQPVNEITAIVLCEVFEIGGNFLLENYKNHFKSLLDLVQRQYIPAMKKVTLDGCHGSVSRLEDFFDKFKASQTIPKAEGYLQSGFL